MEIVFIYIGLAISGLVLLVFLVINDKKTLKNNDSDNIKKHNETKKVIKELSKKYKDKNLN